jgi:translation initiation factor 2B subunit (eIF-2B alpha/beta/delta family)
MRRYFSIPGAIVGAFIGVASVVVNGRVISVIGTCLLALAAYVAGLATAR